jgi:hypothetical protein
MRLDSPTVAQTNRDFLPGSVEQSRPSAWHLYQNAPAAAVSGSPVSFAISKK